MTGLGEPADFPRDDETYDPASGFVSRQVQDLREKITGIQQKINVGDLTMDALVKTRYALQLKGNADPDDIAFLNDAIERGNELRVRMALAADAINVAAQAANAVGLRMPVLSTGLGAIQIGPLALAVGAGVLAGAAIMSWANPALDALDRIIIRLDPGLTPEEKNEAIAAAARARAVANESESPFLKLIKWGVIGAGVYVVYKMWKDR
jgi:hypothetical protein